MTYYGGQGEMKDREREVAWELGVLTVQDMEFS